MAYKSKVKGLAVYDGSDAARRLRCALNGRKRNAFWAALGHPNLKRAQAINRIKKLHHVDKETARRIYWQEQLGTPYQGPELSEVPSKPAVQVVPTFTQSRGL